MAVALRGSAWVPSGNPTTSFTATIDAAVVAGDILYMVCTSRDHTSGTGLATLTDDDTGGNTWTLVTNSTDRVAYLFSKIATSGTASKTVTFSGAVGSCSGVGKAFSGASVGDQTKNAAVEDNAAGDETDGGFTPTVADSMLCCSIHNYNNDNAVTSLSSATYGAMTVTEKLSMGGSDCATAFGHDLMSGASATGNITWSQTDGVTHSIHWSVQPANPQTATPTTLALTLTTFAPVIQLSVIPPVLALALTTFAPIVNLAVIPPTKALTITTFAPTVTVEGTGVIVTQRGATNTGTDALNVSVASVTLTVDRVYVAFIYTCIESGVAPAVVSLSGTGLSMVKITTTGDAEDNITGGARRVEAWVGKCTSSGTVTITAELSDTSENSDLAIYELRNVDNSGTDGETAIVQAVCATGASISSLTITMAAFSDADNRPLAFAIHRFNEATDHDTGAEYTELLDASHADPLSGMGVQWHALMDDNEPDFSWANASDAGGIALEIATAPSDILVTVPLASLSLATFAPKLDLGVIPPTVALTSTGFAPRLDLVVIPSNASLATSAFEPTITVSGNVEVVVPTANVATTTFEPQVNLVVTVPTVALIATAFAPQSNLGVVVPKTDLTTTTFVPEIGLTIVVPVADLSLTGFAPDVVVPQSVEVIVPTAELSTTTFSPTVTSSTPLAIVTQGPWLVGGVAGSVALQPGDEIYFVLTGPAADAPRVRISIPLC